MKKIQVIVSHPAKHHVHQLCAGLSQKGRLDIFFTSLWYKPSSGFYQLLSSVPGLAHQLKKRYHPSISGHRIRTFPWPEILRQILDKLLGIRGEAYVLWVERIHDHYVSGKVNNDSKVVIGYEKACWRTFKSAQKLGKITVLDLAQVHYNHIAELRECYPLFRSLMSEYLFQKINRVKEKDYQYADYVLALSTYARDTLLRAGIPPEKIRIVNLGFDPERFQPKTSYRRQGNFRLLFVGSLTLRKGIHLLLEAFRQLSLPDAELVLVGPMADAKDILNNYKGLFTHYPYMHHEELGRQYQLADLFVFPSYLDSWAMTVVEAMACGTPAIVSEHTGAKDAVGQGGGKVIPVDDMEALKKAILCYYQERELVERDGRRAASIAAAYTWQHYYDQIEAFIKEITSQYATVH